MRNVAESATCSKCATAFAPLSNRAKYCPSCSTHTCEHCRRQFVKPPQAGRVLRFCSPDCLNAWQSTPEGREAGRARTLKARGNGVTIICRTCHEPFYVNKHRAERYNTSACSSACRDRQAEQEGIERVLRFPKRAEANRLEAAGRALLDAIRASYQEQQVIGGKFVVDVLIPDRRIVIQWDGDFWHANPAIYPEPAFDIQRANVARDRACNAYLTKCGYRVLRFWETDVHARPSWVSGEITRALAISEST